VSGLWTTPAPAQPPATPGRDQRAISWRVFLRALAFEMEAQAGSEASATVLRATGQQMARMLALPPVASMEALEMEMNAVLAELDWGRVTLTLRDTERFVELRHAGLPALGSAGDPPGFWLAPVLEGLYETWMGQQPGADDALRARLYACGDEVLLRYGRV